MEEEMNGTTISTRAWCDLPSELLREIANTLGLFDLLCFRGVCKDWRSASVTASASIESTPGTKPSFLLHSDNEDKSIFFNNATNKRYAIDIPELKESTCLGSSQGWLLLYQKGFVFFFCPFSRAKIDLPQIQEPEVSKGVAVFSSHPFSSDCVTAIIYRKDDHTLELNVLERRGVSSWTKYEHKHARENFGDVKGATFVDGGFEFMDNKDKLLKFIMEDKCFKMYTIVHNSYKTHLESLKFRYKEKYFSSKDLKRKMELGDDVTVVTCSASYFGRDCETVIKSENIKAMEEGSETQHFKGIWIQPRFFQLPPNYSWSL